MNHLPMNLPEQVLEKLLNYLDYDDLIALSKVFDNLTDLIARLLQVKLVWIKRIDETTNFIRLIAAKHVKSDADSFVTRSLLRFRLNHHLHSSIVRLITYTPFVLVGLRLDNLVHLEIHNSTNEKRSDSTVINLKFNNLKYLNLQLQLYSNIRFDTPNLIALRLPCSQQRVQILNPKRIKTLNCSTLDNSILAYKNVTSLIIDKFNYDRINYNLFKRFGKLNEIQLYSSSKGSFDKLIKQKRECKSSAKIYLNSLNVEMPDFNWMEIKNLEYCLNEKKYSIYQSNADHVSGEIRMHNFFIESNLNVKMDFFPKLLNVRSLYVNTHRISLNNWIKLLKALKLNGVYISAKLEQNYLNLLAKYCVNLRSLSLDWYDDLNFLFKFKCLQHITLAEFPTVELFKKLANSFEHCLSTIRVPVGEHFTFRLTKDLFSLEYNFKDVFCESRDKFLNHTIDSIGSWLQLADGTAICEVDLDD